MERNHDIDFIKGGLVLLMVLYHWLNYFITPVGEIYRYLRFITPSFIFITGFLISSVYTAKYSLDDPCLHWRLLQRGVKLLLLFTALNLLANLAITRNYNGANMGIAAFFEHSYDIYVVGTGRGAVFEVLVPISYILLVAPLFMKVSLLLKCPFPLAAFVGFVSVLLLSMITRLGGNLALMGMGFLGMALGGVARPRLDRALGRTIALVGVYLLYLVGLVLWNVIYPIQVVGVCSNLWLLYCLSRQCGSQNLLSRGLIELGKYSLFAYVFHIAIFQVLRACFRDSAWGAAAVVLPLAVTAAVTFLAVKVIDVARARSTEADRIYRVVFA